MNSYLEALVALCIQKVQEPNGVQLHRASDSRYKRTWSETVRCQADEAESDSDPISKSMTPNFIERSERRQLSS